MLTVTIDWLAVNFKPQWDLNGEWKDETRDFMRTYASFGTTQNVTPRFGYASATMDDYGCVHMWNDDREDMGHHFIFSGSALRNLFEREEIHPRALLRACVNSRGSISRLDLAKDLTGEPLDLSAIYKSLEQGRNTGTARTHGRIVSNGGGDTIYIGSRQSDKFIRLYDKAAQMDLADDIWFRLELECKGMFARSIASVLIASEDWGLVFDTALSSMVRLPIETGWGKFRSMGSTTIGLPKMEKRTDREKWISEQVIPAVAKHYIDNPTSESVTRLIETLNLIDRQRKL